MGAEGTIPLNGHSGAARADISRPGFQRFATRSVPPRDRLDYWRQLFTAPFIDKSPVSPASDDYQGEFLSSGSHDGIAFVNIRADSNVCHFGKRESGLVLLGYIRCGRVGLQQGGETTVLGPEGGLVLFDCDRPVSMTASRHEMSYLALPRAFVAATLGTGAAAHGVAALRLARGGLGPVLRAHLEAMTLYGERLDAFEARAAVQAASALATTLLAGARRRRLEAGAFDGALFEAARRYIELNMGTFSLTAEQIAAGLGCSRAHLYRVFAQRGRTVAGYLRDLRLRQARLLLETHAADPIGMIAFRCGYQDLSTFGKAFRRHFGMSPSECREISPADTGEERPC